MIFENFAKCYFLICIADKGQQDPKGPQDIGVEVEPKSKPLPNVERPFRPCKLPQLLLAKFFLSRPVIVITGQDMTGQYIISIYKYAL